MNERILTLYKRKIAIANIFMVFVVTLIAIGFNKLNYRDMNLLLFITFSLMFIISNITKVQGPLYMIFPSMRELYNLENPGFKEEPSIKNKALLVFMALAFLRIFERNNIIYTIDFKIYIITLVIILLITNFSLRGEYKSIFNHKKG